MQQQTLTAVRGLARNERFLIAWFPALQRSNFEMIIYLREALLTFVRWFKTRVSVCVCVCVSVCLSGK